MRELKFVNDLQEIADLQKSIEKAEENAKYLFGGKKGLVWGRRTAADERREREISKMKSKLASLQNNYRKNYLNNKEATA